MVKISANLPPLTGKETQKATFPDVAKTPAAPAPVPIPYPNVGDSFERVAKGGLGALLTTDPATKAGSKGLSPQQRQVASQVAAMLDKGDAAGGLAQWTDAVAHDPGVPVMELLAYTATDLMADVQADVAKLFERRAGSSGKSAHGAGAAVDPNALVQHVLRESYLETTEDLGSFAEKVKYFNEAKKELREAITELREQGLDAGAWEEKLAALGDDAQLANVDLQNVLQKQQQTLQMMSNISKMLFDTAQGVIRKMGG